MIEERSPTPLPHPLLSIIVIARDEIPGLLQATVRGVQRTCDHLAFELIVVDDASTTPVPEQHDVRLVRHPLPLGSQRARRTGAENARGEVLLWLDSHMSFEDGWADSLLENLGPKTLLCSAWWNYTRTKGYCWGADFRWIDHPIRARGERIGFSAWGRTVAGASPIEVPMVIGACYMMLKEAYDAIGGVSPLLKKWGLEEPDLSCRLWLTGGRVVCVPAARVGHYDRSSPKSFFVLRPEHLYNQAAFIRSNFSLKTAAALERELGPLPPVVHEWLRRNADAITARREMLDRYRTMSDAEFCERFGQLFNPAVRAAFQTP